MRPIQPEIKLFVHLLIPLRVPLRIPRRHPEFLLDLRKSFRRSLTHPLGCTHCPVSQLHGSSPLLGFALLALFLQAADQGALHADLVAIFVEEDGNRDAGDLDKAEQGAGPARI